VQFAYQTFGIWEAAYLNHQEGLMGEGLWQAWDGVGRSQWRGAGFRCFWQHERSGHAFLFQQHVDAEIFPKGAGS